jgi:hypothetical protein
MIYGRNILDIINGVLHFSLQLLSELTKWLMGRKLQKVENY